METRGHVYFSCLVMHILHRWDLGMSSNTLPQVLCYVQAWHRESGMHGSLCVWNVALRDSPVVPARWGITEDTRYSPCVLRSLR